MYRVQSTGVICEDSGPPANVRLTSVQVKPEGESSFSSHAPSEVVGVRTGGEVRFEGIVTDAEGEPVSNQQVEVYDALQYAPDAGDDGMRTIATGSDGTFTYPSGEGGVSTASLPAGVRPFWFKAAADAAVPFALFLYTEEQDAFAEAERRLQRAVVEQSENIRSIQVDTNPASSFSELSVNARSYPADDTDLSSAANDAFFRYYALTYTGPTDVPFLTSDGASTSTSEGASASASSEGSAGWLTRGHESYQERIDQVLDDLPERSRNYEPTAGSTAPIVDLSNDLDLDLPSTISDSDALIIGGEFLVCGVSVAGAVGSGGIATGAAAAGCKPLAMTLFKEGASYLCDSFARKIENEEKREYNLTKCKGIDVVGVVGNAASAVTGGVTVWADAIEATSPALIKLGGELEGALDEASADLFQDDSGNYKGASLRNVEITNSPPGGSTNATTSDASTSEATASDVFNLDIHFTRPNRPTINLDSEFDNPTNPSALNVTVETSRPLYQPSTTDQTPPTLGIGDEDFSLERTDSNEGPARTYEARIAVSQLPGYGEEGTSSLSASISTSGTTFETVRGGAEGAFSGLEAKVLELLERASSPSGATNATFAQAATPMQDTLATLDVPENVFGGATAFTDLSAVTYSEVANPEQPELRPRSVVARINAGDRAFKRSATLTFRTDSLAEGEDACVYWRRADSTWQPLVSTRNRAAGTATTEIIRPGDYAVLAGGASASEEPLMKRIAVAAGRTDTLDLGTSGAAVNITGNTDPDGGWLQFARRDTTPPKSSFAGSAPSPGGATVTPNKTAGRYWTISTDSLTDASYRVRFDTASVAGIEEANRLLILKRSEAGDAWTPLATSFTDDGALVTRDTLNSFSQFTIGANTESNPLPIELASFEATAEADDRTVLSWQTTSETNNEGFHIERSTSGPEGDFEKIGFHKGAGTTTEAQTYRFTDEDVPFEAKKLTYRLRQEDRDGNVQYSKPVEVEVRGSSELALHGTFPNPFEEQATVRYSVPERMHVRLAVYDALGRRVRTLVDEQQEGRQETSFRAKDLSSGTYFYRLEARGRVLTGSVVLVR